MNTCRRFKTLSVAYEAASYLRYVAKIHLKHNRTSKWRRSIGRPAARSHSNTAVRDQVAWLKTQLVVCWSRTSVLRNANSQEPELPAALAAPVSVLSAHGLKRCEASHVPNSGNIFLDIEC